MGHLSLYKLATSSKVGLMRYAELTFLVLLVAYHCFLIVPRRKRPFSSNYLIFLAGMALAWNLGLEGLRWQTLPGLVLLVVDAVVLFPTFATLRGQRRRGILAALGATARTLVALVALVWALSSAALAVAFPLPQVELTGGLAPAYRDIRFPAQGSAPGLEVQVWYPASGDTRSRPRPGPGPESGRAPREGGLPAFWEGYLDHLPSNLIRGGRMATVGTRFAVIYVAVPSGQAPEDFGYLFEDLASRGFVVVSGAALSPPVTPQTDFRWERAWDDLAKPIRDLSLWVEPEASLNTGAKADYRWLTATRNALRQLDNEPGDVFFGAIDWQRQALWAWGSEGPSAAEVDDLGLKGAVIAGGRGGTNGATMPELRIVQGPPGPSVRNLWFLSTSSLHRADLADAAYIKPYLAFRGLKTQADAGLHGALRQYQAAFYQALLWDKGGVATFGQSIPEIPGLVLTGR